MQAFGLAVVRGPSEAIQYRLQPLSVTVALAGQREAQKVNIGLVAMRVGYLAIRVGEGRAPIR